MIVTLCDRFGSDISNEEQSEGEKRGERRERVEEGGSADVIVRSKNEFSGGES